MAAKHRKAVWVLDRPNPGRPAGRRAHAARRLGEFCRRGADADAPWADARRAGPVVRQARSSSMSSIASSRWRAGSPTTAPGFGWPLGERNWVNPSPNAPNLWMARAYAGTVMLEGTTLSEGRGTTRPLELFGAPDIDARRLIAGDACAGAAMAQRAARCAISGSSRRSTSMSGKLCNGVQIHTEGPGYDHQAFKPWRIQALAFKAIRRLHPDYRAVARFSVRVRERQARHRRHQRRPAAARMGGRQAATPHDLDALTVPDEQAWLGERQPHLRY